MRFFALFLGLIACASAVSVPFTTCGTGDFIASAVDVNPFPPQRGKSVLITTTGRLASQVSGGKFEVDVSLAGITLLKQNGDMCKFSPDLKCPQPVGDLTARYTIDVPAIAPNGKYQIKFTGTQQDGKQLFCIQSEFEIKSSWDVSEPVLEILDSNTLVGSPVPFSNCESGDLQIKSVDVLPFPPKRGTTSKIVAKGSLAAAVTSGTFEVDVLLGGLTVLKKSGDLCKFSPDVTCPAAVGDLTVSYALDVPSIAPDGKYQIKFKGVQQDKKTLFCVTSEFEIKTFADAEMTVNFEEPSNALVPVSSNTAVPFTTCEAGTLFTAKSVDVTPFPPLKGKDAKIVVAGHLASQVTSGKFEVDVSLGGITLLKQSGDICKFSPDVSCPSKTGDMSVSYAINVPSIAPDGKYDIKFRGTEQNGKTVFCITSEFQLKSSWKSNVVAVAFPQPQPVNTAVPFTTCGTGDFVISAVDVTPYPPVRGKSVTIVATGNLASQVTAGTFEVDVQLAGITVLKQNGDICKFSKDVTCPSKTGSITLSYDMAVPSIAPPGTYDIVFKGTQQDGKSLYCVKSSFKL